MKRKFQPKKLNLNKTTVSNIQMTDIRGGGPITEITKLNCTSYDLPCEYSIFPCISRDIICDSRGTYCTLCNC